MRTFVMIKPDGVQRAISGTVIQRFEDKGFKIVGLKLMRISPELAGKHYGEHVGKPFYDKLISYITSGPVIAMVLEGNAAYEGDMYGPGSRVQITPWTAPSTSRPDGSASWVALDDIRYTGNGTEMAFELVRDFRRRPIVRENSRIGKESSGIELLGQVWVGQGVELTVGDADVLMVGGLRVDRDARVVIEKEATVRIGGPQPLRLFRRASLLVAGTLDVQGLVEAHRTAYIELLPGAQLLRPQGRTVAFERQRIDV